MNLDEIQEIKETLYEFDYSIDQLKRRIADLKQRRGSAIKQLWPDYWSHCQLAWGQGRCPLSMENFLRFSTELAQIDMALEAAPDGQYEAIWAASKERVRWLNDVLCY